MYLPPQKEKGMEFEQLSLKYMNEVHRLARTITRNTWDAQDLVQDTLLRAYLYFNQFKPGTNFTAWIFKILTNTYINGYRKKQREPVCVGLETIMPYYNHDEIDSPVIFEENLEYLLTCLSDELYEAFNSLPEIYKDVIFLLDILEYSIKECSIILGCPLGTVMSRHFRAKKLLRQKFVNF